MMSVKAADSRGKTVCRSGTDEAGISNGRYGKKYLVH